MTALLLAEHDNHTLHETTARALTAARAMATDVHVLCVGAGCDAVAAQAAKLASVERVLRVDAEESDHILAEPVAALMAGMAERYTHIVAPATANGKNILPRVAGLLDVMILSDISAVIDAQTFERPIYAGNAVQRVRSSDRVKVVTVRTTCFDPAPENGAAPVEAAGSLGKTALSTWVEDRVGDSERPELTSARIVISGGRGMGGAENFGLIETIAAKLGAAIGASRAAVDAGYAANDMQVGQTGKVVAPDLYIAVGISGAIQHLAGMKDSKIIVAINKDEEAPIFQIADYGLVADLFEALPELEAAL